MEWFDSQVETISRDKPARKVVILTHHLPTIYWESVNPKYENSTISSGFSTDLNDRTCWKNDKVKVWAFGHTHYNCDYVDDGTQKRVVTNQRGYYFAQAEGFEDGKIIEI